MNQTFFAVLLSFGLALPLVGQTSPPKAIPVEEASTNPEDGYLLKEDDVLELVVFGEDDLATTTRILKTGEAVFPLIGSVDLSGLGLPAATARVRDLYGARFLVDPKVTLSVSSYGKHFVSVIGAFNSPGELALPSAGKLDLASAVAMAGGLANDADATTITVVRAKGGSSSYSREQIVKIGGSVRLEAGDRVIAGQSRFIGKSVTIMGKVMRPGPVEFPVDGELDLLGAIARAGGFHELANEKKVTLNRKGKVQVIDVRALREAGDSVYPLKPGDVISVPQRYW
jgi:polysaccharide biosynthesis/export protein